MKAMQGTMYHMLLRTGALLFALLLLFDSGMLSPVTSKISHDTQRYIATAIGVGARIEPTPLNTLTAEITAKNNELAAREAAIAEREIEVGIADSAAVERIESDISTYILSVLLFIIIVLIVLNYALDFARERRLLRSARTTYV